MRRLIRARKRHNIPRVVRPRSPRDSELRTRDVKLGAADRAGAVQANVLGAKQVVAVLQTAGDLHADGAGACIFIS